VILLDRNFNALRGRPGEGGYMTGISAKRESPREYSGQRYQQQSCDKANIIGHTRPG
jgi:hypothetical protein